MLCKFGQALCLGGISRFKIYKCGILLLHICFVVVFIRGCMGDMGRDRTRGGIFLSGETWMIYLMEKISNCRLFISYISRIRF